MSKTQQTSKCENCGKSFLLIELKIHKKFCTKNNNLNTVYCFQISQNVKNNPIAPNIQYNYNNFSNNFISSISFSELCLDNINSTSEEKLNTDGINNVKDLNSNFNNNNINEMMNQNIFNMISENSVNITEKHPLPLTILNRLNVNLIKKDNLKNDNECIICQEKFKLGEKYILLPCFHNYHENCIKQWFSLNNKCPICNHNVEDNEIF